MRDFTDKEILDTVERLPTFKGWKKGPYDIWVRSSADAFDQFDDKAFTYHSDADDERPKFFMSRSGTTNAGSYGLKNFQDYNHEGCAVLKADVIVYGSHTYGLHHGKPAYRQAKSWPYFRDNNRNQKAEEIGPERSGIIGANIHRAGVNSTVIKNWSTACLVTSNLAKFLAFLAYMKQLGYPPLNVAILKEASVGRSVSKESAAASTAGKAADSSAGESAKSDPTGGTTNSDEQPPATQTPPDAMPEPAAPPVVTEQTSDIQVSDGTTAVAASTKVGGFKWLMGSIIAIVTGQATVPEFVGNGLQSPSFWTVVLNIFANLWAFKVYIIGAILVIFIVRKIEATVLKVAAMRINADGSMGNVVLTKPTAKSWSDTLMFWR